MAKPEDAERGAGDQGARSVSQHGVEPMNVYAVRHSASTKRRRLVQASALLVLLAVVGTALTIAPSKQPAVPSELAMSILVDAEKQAVMRSQFEEYSRRPSSEKVAKQALRQLSTLRHESESRAQAQLANWGFRPPSRSDESSRHADRSHDDRHEDGNPRLADHSLGQSLSQVVSALEDTLHGRPHAEELRQDSGELMKARRLIDQALEDSSRGSSLAYKQDMPRSSGEVERRETEGRRQMEERHEQDHAEDSREQDHAEDSRRGHLPDADNYRYWNGGGAQDDSVTGGSVPPPQLRGASSDYVSSVWGDRAQHELAVPYQAVRGEKLRGEEPLQRVEAEHRRWPAEVQQSEYRDGGKPY